MGATSVAPLSCVQKYRSCGGRNCKKLTNHRPRSTRRSKCCEPFDLTNRNNRAISFSHWSDVTGSRGTDSQSRVATVFDFRATGGRVLALRQRTAAKLCESPLSVPICPVWSRAQQPDLQPPRWHRPTRTRASPIAAVNPASECPPLLTFYLRCIFAGESEDHPFLHHPSPVDVREATIENWRSSGARRVTIPMAFISNPC